MFFSTSVKFIMIGHRDKFNWSIKETHLGADVPASTPGVTFRINVEPQVDEAKFWCFAQINILENPLSKWFYLYK